MLTKLLHSEWQFKRDIAGIMPTCCVIGCSNSTRKTKKKNDQSTPLGKTTSQLIFASDYNGLTVFVGFWFYQLLSQLISFATSFRIFDLNLAIMNSYWTTFFDDTQNTLWSLTRLIKFMIFTFCTNFEQLSRYVLVRRLTLKCIHELK